MVVASDGFFDNVYDDVMVDMIAQRIKLKGGDLQDCADDVAESLLDHAHNVASGAAYDVHTPFSDRARREQILFRFVVTV